MGNRVLLSFLGCAVAASTAVAEPRYELDGSNLKVPHPVTFETGKPALRPDSGAALDYVKGYLDDKTYVTLLRIEVHTDNTGNATVNQDLSEKRALAVAKALVAKGVSCKRLIAVGFGSSKPTADNATPEGRAQNRRVTFANVELRGRVIGGLPKDGGGKVAGEACE
jgi:OmpA-OmpF porin, OOP family